MSRAPLPRHCFIQDKPTSQQQPQLHNLMGHAHVTLCPSTSYHRPRSSKCEHTRHTHIARPTLDTEQSFTYNALACTPYHTHMLNHTHAHDTCVACFSLKRWL